MQWRLAYGKRTENDVANPVETRRYSLGGVISTAFDSVHQFKGRGVGTLSASPGRQFVSLDFSVSIVAETLGH